MSARALPCPQIWSLDLTANYHCLDFVSCCRGYFKFVWKRVFMLSLPHPESAHTSLCGRDCKAIHLDSQLCLAEAEAPCRRGKRIRLWTTFAKPFNHFIQRLQPSLHVSPLSFVAFSTATKHTDILLYISTGCPKLRHLVLPSWSIKVISLLNTEPIAGPGVIMKPSI